MFLCKVRSTMSPSLLLNTLILNLNYMRFIYYSFSFSRQRFSFKDVNIFFFIYSYVKKKKLPPTLWPHSNLWIMIWTNLNTWIYPTWTCVLTTFGLLANSFLRRWLLNSSLSIFLTLCLLYKINTHIMARHFLSGSRTMIFPTFNQLYLRMFPQ